MGHVSELRLRCRYVGMEIVQFGDRQEYTGIDDETVHILKTIVRLSAAPRDFIYSSNSDERFWIYIAAFKD